MRPLGVAAVSVRMENLFHIRPPTTRCDVDFGKGSLARLTNRPPFECFGMFSYGLHIRIKIVTDIFKVAKQIMFSVWQLLEINGVIANIGLLYAFKYLGPGGSVKLLVFLNFARPDFNDVCVAFHCCRGRMRI